jgi:hypothetical protein
MQAREQGINTMTPRVRWQLTILPLDVAKALQNGAAQAMDKKNPARRLDFSYVFQRLAFLAERTGLEPATPGVTGRYSNQLNYRSTSFIVRKVNRELAALTSSRRCFGVP